MRVLPSPAFSATRTGTIARRPAGAAPLPHPGRPGEDRPRPAARERVRLKLRFRSAADRG